MTRPNDNYRYALGYYIGMVLAVGCAFVVTGLSIGVVVLTWRWTMTIVRGGCP